MRGVIKVGKLQWKLMNQPPDPTKCITCDWIYTEACEGGRLGSWTPCAPYLKDKCAKRKAYENTRKKI